MDIAFLRVTTIVVLSMGLALFAARFAPPLSSSETIVAGVAVVALSGIYWLVWRRHVYAAGGPPLR